MIRLEISGCCKNCPHIEIKMDYIYAGTRRLYTECDCVHADVCRNRLEEEDAPRLHDYNDLPD